MKPIENEETDRELKLIYANDQVDSLFKCFIVLCLGAVPSSCINAFLPAYILWWGFFDCALIVATIQRLRLGEMDWVDAWKIVLMWVVAGALTSFVSYMVIEGSILS